MSRFQRLRRGRVYTTEEVGGPKTAQLMIFAGWIEALGKGLYWASPDRSVGKTRPSDLEILSVLLRGKSFLVTGNERWDALGLGVTKPLGKVLVYTLRRKGENVIGGRTFWFVRVYKGVRLFPTGPVREWWVADLLENLELAGLQRDAVIGRLSEALAAGRFSREVLVDQATRWATPEVLRMVSSALAGASLPRTGLVPRIGLSASSSTGPRARRKRQQAAEDAREDAQTTK
jgi:hypothetical protein